MRRISAAVLATALACFVVTATTGAQIEPSAQPVLTASLAQSVPAPPQCASPGQHKRQVIKALRFSATNGNFVATKNVKALRRADDMRACAKQHFPHRYKLMRRGWSKRLAVFRFYHYIDVITPFGAWAIPPAIVRCEGGFHGWRTYNHGGSGAAGPYQLLGWGAPMPAISPRAMAMHHIIAHRLYAAHGSQPWSSSSSCWS